MALSQHWGCGLVCRTMPLAVVLNYSDISRQFDTPCFFGRDVAKFKTFAKHWYGDNLRKNMHDVNSSIPGLHTWNHELNQTAPSISDHTGPMPGHCRPRTTSNIGGLY